MRSYDHKKIEHTWQKTWLKEETYKTRSSAEAGDALPFYVLDMFPYPSGAGLHVGHPRGYIGSDVLARKKRMEGFNVLHPMGYDAFGLPAEQYAITKKIHPNTAVKQNIATFEKQLALIGLSYDPARKVNTTDPAYYKWTQWIFLKIYDSWFDTEKKTARPIAELITIFEQNGNGAVQAWHTCPETFSAQQWQEMNERTQQSIVMQYRLAYEGYSDVNWCPELGTVLANDEIVDSPEGPVSERGGYPVEKKQMRQWYMRITAYGERLLSDLDLLEWPEHIKEIQRNWIGLSEGSQISFPVVGGSEHIEVFTTRADTLYGVTYIVLAPEHPLVEVLAKRSGDYDAIASYCAEAKKKDDIARSANEKEKTGVSIAGVFVKNPATGESIPVWVADYVLPHYGTGAVMAVPMHDERDFAFAQKYFLPMKQVIAPLVIDQAHLPREGKENTKRTIVTAIVKHPSEDMFISLTWKKLPWKTFVTGGIEDGEDPIEAARREIREETGYVHARFEKQMPFVISAQFYAEHKDINRSVISHVLVFTLEDLEQEMVKPHESAQHEPVWMPMEEMKTLSPVSELSYVLEWLAGKEGAVTEEGLLINSADFTGCSSEEARTSITERFGGSTQKKFKFRDAVFARQRYWGEPIPLRKDAEGIIHPLPLKELPLKLPSIKKYEPIGNGESPLAGVKAWIKEGYETNTMPGWAGSSWYFLRYLDPKNSEAFASEAELAYWFGKKNTGGVDVYIGGAEHATGHLLYSRFWHKVLFDYGYVPTPEPFQKLKNQGIILAGDGRKMSKRWGNVVNPDDIVATYGADTLRLYEMFMGPFEATLPWSTESIIGPRRFIERVWRLSEKVTEAVEKKEYEIVLHQTIKKVTEDIEGFGFNTAVSSMMICLNEMEKSEAVAQSDYCMFLQLLAPFAPHVTEELWHRYEKGISIHHSSWPLYDEKKLYADMMTIVIQVNGKMRGTIEISRTADQKTIEEKALQEERVQAILAGSIPQKIIYVPGRLVNIVHSL